MVSPSAGTSWSVGVVCGSSVVVSGVREISLQLINSVLRFTSTHPHTYANERLGMPAT